MKTECFVSAEDYVRYFQGLKDEDLIVPIWNGQERRSGMKDRRTKNHERRWEASRGRRFRVGDRRIKR